MDEGGAFPCPCCGFFTLNEQSPSDDICPVCFWQDDFVDNHDTDVLGPNPVRLSVARMNYNAFGASHRRRLPHVRKPRPEEGPPKPWTERRTKDEM
jgi:hypothetical protein